MAMDVARPDRARKRRIKRLLYLLLALAIIPVITLALSRLKPAAPAVERATVWLDTVKRGSIPRNVRGLGTLVPEEIITDVMERLHHSELVDDQRFAKTWVENRMDFHPRSRRALTYELREKGIDEQAIQQTLDDFDELTAAYQAASKYAQKSKQLEWPEFRQKLYAFLTRRGFNYDTVKTTVARLHAERDAQSATDNTPLYEEVDL